MADQDYDDFDGPSGPEFEIDANASAYVGYVPKTIAFQAGALNGAPPFVFTWDFRDGSPPGYGPYIVHVFQKPGTHHVLVTGTDAKGELSRVDLLVNLLSREQYAEQKAVPLSSLATETPRDYVTPTFATPERTPAAGATPAAATR